MKKMHLTAARTIDKLKDDVDKEEHEWKEHTTKVIEDLRHDNQHMQKLHELAQVRLPPSMRFICVLFPKLANDRVTTF